MELARRLRGTTLEDARASFEELIKVGCEEKVSPLSRIGLKTLDHFFFGHRLKAKTKRHISFVEAMQDRKVVRYINEKIRQIKANPDQIFANRDELLRQQYSVFQLYYGSINQFRPTEAMRIYCILKPKVGILDFSAGWGGRCLGAMALGIPYIGIDANKQLEGAYTAMKAAVAPDAKVKLLFQPSETVDFSKYNYDLVFTSPPYFTLEEYEGMPTYEGDEGFMEEFFRPVIEKAWQHLRMGGHLALNMPETMYKGIRHCLPPLDRKIKLPISNRHPTNAALGRSIGTEGVRYEYTYVWKKVGKRPVTCRKTRRLAK
jgi:hypothetical protein